VKEPAVESDRQPPRHEVFAHEVHGIVCGTRDHVGSLAKVVQRRACHPRWGHHRALELVEVDSDRVVEALGLRRPWGNDENVDAVLLQFVVQRQTK
jgi:hypothetical protein